MDTKPNTRSSVDSHSPLLAKSRGSSSTPSAGQKKPTGAKDAEARKNETRDALNPKHPVWSIPFSMKQW